MQKNDHIKYLLVFCIKNFKKIGWIQTHNEYLKSIDEPPVSSLDIQTQIQAFISLTPDLDLLSDRQLFHLVKKPLTTNLFKWTQDLGIYDTHSHHLTITVFVPNKTLRKGQCFGELALKGNRGRAARVDVVANKVTLGVLQKRDYKMAIEESFKREINAKVSFLRNFKIFKHMS